MSQNKKSNDKERNYAEKDFSKSRKRRRQEREVSKPKSQKPESQKPEEFSIIYGYIPGSAPQQPPAWVGVDTTTRRGYQEYDHEYDHESDRFAADDGGASLYGSQSNASLYSQNDRQRHNQPEGLGDPYDNLVDEQLRRACNQGPPPQRSSLPTQHGPSTQYRPPTQNRPPNQYGPPTQLDPVHNEYSRTSLGRPGIQVQSLPANKPNPQTRGSDYEASDNPHSKDTTVRRSRSKTKAGRGSSCCPCPGKPESSTRRECYEDWFKVCLQNYVVGLVVQLCATAFVLGMYFMASAPNNAQAMIAIAGFCTTIAIGTCNLASTRENQWSKVICLVACVVLVIASLVFLCSAYVGSPIIRDTQSSKVMVILLLSLSVGLISAWFPLTYLQCILPDEEYPGNVTLCLFDCTSKEKFSSVRRLANDHGDA